MENDQAARLRTMVREARRLTVLESAPPLIGVATVDHQAFPHRAEQLVASLVVAARQAGVTLAKQEEPTCGADWLYRVLDGGVEEEPDTWQRASTVLLATDVSPDGVLATYRWLKRQHRLGPPPAVWLVFEGASEEEGSRAFESLRATCQRFLGWESLDWSTWSRSAEDSRLAFLVEKLAARLPVASKRGVTNPLAAVSPEAV